VWGVRVCAAGSRTSKPARRDDASGGCANRSARGRPARDVRPAGQFPPGAPPEARHAHGRGASMGGRVSSIAGRRPLFRLRLSGLPAGTAAAAAPSRVPEWEALDAWQRTGHATVAAADGASRMPGRQTSSARRSGRRRGDRAARPRRKCPRLAVVAAATGVTNGRGGGRRGRPGGRAGRRAVLDEKRWTKNE